MAFLTTLTVASLVALGFCKAYADWELRRIVQWQIRRDYIARVCGMPTGR